MACAPLIENFSITVISCGQPKEIGVNKQFKNISVLMETTLQDLPPTSYRVYTPTQDTTKILSQNNRFVKKHFAHWNIKIGRNSLSARNNRVTNTYARVTLDFKNPANLWDKSDNVNLKIYSISTMYTLTPF